MSPVLNKLILIFPSLKLVRYPEYFVFRFFTNFSSINVNEEFPFSLLLSKKETKSAKRINYSADHDSQIMTMIIPNNYFFHYICRRK